MSVILLFSKYKNFDFFFFAEYVKAAQILKEEDSTIKLAKVDGPEESALLEKMHVTGYPTIFFYRDGEPIKYGGINFLFNFSPISTWPSDVRARGAPKRPKF